jgi:hypothetical protein
VRVRWAWLATCMCAHVADTDVASALQAGRACGGLRVSDVGAGGLLSDWKGKDVSFTRGTSVPRFVAQAPCSTGTLYPRCGAMYPGSRCLRKCVWVFGAGVMLPACV